MRSSPCAVAAVLAALGLSASAQLVYGPVPSRKAPAAIDSAAARTPSDAREERRFLRDAAAQSRFELDASRLAIAKSGNTAVRALAASLISHHNTIGLELAHLLHSRAMAAPMMTNEQRKSLNRLTRLSGKKFDAFYMQRVGLAQAVVARDYERAGAAIREPQINAWIVRTLAATRSHQNMAERSLSGDPQPARWSRAAPRPGTQTPAPQARLRPTASQTVAPAGKAGVQPVSVMGSGPLNASGSR